MTHPAYLDDGFAPAGPQQIRCQYCGRRISSNAYARASHRRTCSREQPAPRPAPIGHEPPGLGCQKETETMARKLSAPQCRFLSDLADGEKGPPSGGAKAAAWWRTATALRERGLVTRATGPEGHVWYRLTEAGRKALAETE